MPYPAQIDRNKAVDMASALIESDGIDSLSLAKVAAALGIKAPSLYHHFNNKAELMQGVGLRISEALITAIREAASSVGSEGPRIQIRAMASAYRKFALEHPVTILLAFSNLEPDSRPGPAQLESLVLPLQAMLAVLVGEEHALAALRGLWALVHGFVLLEINGQFQRGGDLDKTLDYAVDAYASGCIELRHNNP